MPATLSRATGAASGAAPHVRQVRQRPAEDGKKEAGLAEAKSWQQGQKQIWGMMMRQTLRSAQQMRELQSTLFDVFLVPEDTPVVLAMQEQTSMYSEAVKNQKNHNLGPPHVWAMGGMLRSFKDVAPNSMDQPINLTQGLHQEIVKAHDEYAEYTLEKKCDLVLVCKVEKVFQKGKKKITLCLRNQAFREMIMQACKGIDQMELKQGRAPSTFLEREIQTVLEAMEGQ